MVATKFLPILPIAATAIGATVLADHAGYLTRLMHHACLLFVSPSPSRFSLQTEAYLVQDMQMPAAYMSPRASLYTASQFPITEFICKDRMWPFLIFMLDTNSDLKKHDLLRTPENEGGQNCHANQTGLGARRGTLTGRGVNPSTAPACQFCHRSKQAFVLCCHHEGFRYTCIVEANTEHLRKWIGM
jgi:hypothetical protein